MEKGEKGADGIVNSQAVKEPPVMRECYDNNCGAICEYLDSDLYEYFDAELGNILAFTCKKCGLTNTV